jgi:predicted MFS family arabinose efflux permease
VTTVGPDRSRAVDSELAVLTGAKVVSNTALRWVGPFLPTLERAFGASTGTLTGVMGACELGGLSTVASGHALDRGHEQRMVTLGLLAVAASSFIALGGSVATFAVSFAVLVLGVTNLTVAGHAWIGHRVPFAARGRAIGLFETSWAIALLVGAPVLAGLIALVGWRGPYAALGVAALAAAWIVHRQVAVSPRPVATAPPTTRARLPRSAWPPMLAAASTAAAGLAIFVVSGAWLDDAYGVSTGGLGVVAAGFGIVELGSSGSVARFGDRIGARRSVAIGLVILVGGLALMSIAGPSRAAAIAGLLLFLCGFEFAFVSALTLVTEAAPDTRGRAIGVANALGTVARSGAVVASGQLYEAFGMTGSLWWAAVSATAAAVMLAATTTGA